MIIEVTQEDIEKGIRMSSLSCPIALALRRTTGRDLRVGHLHIRDGENFSNGVIAHSTWSMQKFIDHFDSGEPVKPFRFRFTEIKGEAHDSTI